MVKKQLRVYMRSQNNGLIHSNQVNAIRSEKHGLRKWWSKVNNMTGGIGNTLSVSSIIHPSVINTFFQDINTDPEHIPLPSCSLRIL